MRALLFTSALGLSLAGPAYSQSAYTTEQLVDFYIKSVNLGATRGICIGTPQECAPKDEKPKGLDMLVTFELDSAELTAEAKQNLAVFAQMMQDERLVSFHFVVEGYTDARGTDAYNMTLSEQRADAVRSYLTELGVSDERLAAVGFGKANPRVPDAFDPENRRVELRIDMH